MTTNYDRIARFYDVDMARNMPFDDVGFYRALAALAGGRVLELGCGNGRILLELLASGIDATGVDASAGMLSELQRKARDRGLAAPVARMDIRRLALRPEFHLVLVPYSLITYMTTAAAVDALLAAAHAVLVPGGRLVLDAFIPRPAEAHPEFTLDYRRPFGPHTLARWKRVQPAGALNRIERRYRVEDAAGHTLEAVDVEEEIRPVAPDALRRHVGAARFEPGREWWDYGTAASSEQTAQFFTLEARRAGASSA